jgi:hypothetical protein
LRGGREAIQGEWAAAVHEWEKSRNDTTTHGERTHGERMAFHDGFTAGVLSGEVAHMKGDPLAQAYARLEIRNEELLAKVYGYVNRMATEPPGQPKGEPRKGREWRKIRHRTPYVLNPDGSWRRVKGQVTRTDFVAKIPPKVCEVCNTLFVARRIDARTCSPACRTALYRKRLSSF